MCRFGGDAAARAVLARSRGLSHPAWPWSFPFTDALKVGLEPGKTCMSLVLKKNVFSLNKKMPFRWS